MERNKNTWNAWIYTTRSAVPWAARRSGGKSCPRESITTGGGALAGEDTARAAMREAREELGLEVDLTGRRPAFTINQGRTFDDYFLVEQAVDLSSLRLQPSEVAEVAWATAEEILQMIREKRFVPLQEGYVRFVFGLRQGGILLPESEWPR